jgi:phosphoribosyl-ATP pyrophosphohydrolase
MTGTFQTLADSTAIENVAANALAVVNPTTRPVCAEHYAGGMPDHEIERLYKALDRVTWADNPLTVSLLASGLRKKSQKVVQEAAEVALEAVRTRCETTLQESADLILPSGCVLA